MENLKKVEQFATVRSHSVRRHSLGILFPKQQNNKNQPDSSTSLEMNKKNKGSSFPNLPDVEESTNFPLSKQKTQSKPLIHSPRKPFAQLYAESTAITNKHGETPLEFLMRVDEDEDLDELGQVLGKNDEFSSFVLGLFIDSFNFKDLRIDEALRIFLQEFLLPVEAQQIDRIINKFSLKYHCDNPNSFSHPDTAYVLSFSLIMLNTDIHNPNVKNKMSKADFIRNNRGIDQGKDIPKEDLERLYDIIKREKFVYPTRTNRHTRQSSDLCSTMPDSELSSDNNLEINPGKSDVQNNNQPGLTQPRNRNSFSLIPSIILRISGFVRRNRNRHSYIRTNNNEPIFLHHYEIKRCSSFNAKKNNANKMKKSMSTGNFIFNQDLGSRTGFLMKKNEYDVGGKKSRVRSWKNAWVVLQNGSLMSYLADENKLTCSEIKLEKNMVLSNAIASIEESYTKKKNVFRVTNAQQQSLLFQAKSRKERDEWIKIINREAAIRTVFINEKEKGKERAFTYELMMEQILTKINFTKTKIDIESAYRSGIEKMFEQYKDAGNKAASMEVYNQQRIWEIKINKLQQELKTLQIYQDVIRSISKEQLHGLMEGNRLRYL